MLAVVAGACGSDDDRDANRPDVVDEDTGRDDVGGDADVGFDDVGDTGSDDVGTDPDTGPDDVGTNPDTGDTGPVDPPQEYDTVACPDVVPAPQTGRLCDVTPGTNGHLLIRGTVLGGTTVYENGAVLIDDTGRNRRITCTGCDCLEDEDAAEATVIACAEGVISPGLINPHDHITYSLSHPQGHGDIRYDHRHDWRRGLRGHRSLGQSPGSDNSHDGILYGELRMLFGGATSVAGSIGSSNASGLLRNLDQTNYTEGLPDIDVSYRTFPLGDSNPRLLASGCNYPSIDSESRLNAGIYLPHLAEGIDAEARNEFVCLQGASGRDLVRENTSIIHGIGLTVEDIVSVAQDGAKLVWSPRSNIDLYGNTAQVGLFKQFGVPIGLGTDWSASGSMNMLRELQCADYLNRHHFNFTFTDQELWMMATYWAAVTMGAENSLGVLLPGYVADITIFDGRSRQPYRAVIDAEVADVSLVLRGGQPLYGDANIVEGLVPAGDIDKCEFIDVCERERRLCVQLDAGKTLGQIRNAVHRDAYALFFCGEPDDEPSCVPFRPNEYTGISNMTDSDGDGIPDELDNCPNVFNPIRPLDGGVQPDTDGDGLGDACDPCPFSATNDCEALDPNDWDGDGVPNQVDNCPSVANPDQTDTSGDGIGDACHPCAEHAISDTQFCPETIYSIKQGTTAEARVQLTEALVTAVRPGEGMFVQVHPDDAEFAGVDHSGLYVFMRGATSMPAPGDRVTMQGQVTEFFGQTQLASVTGLTVVSSGNALPAPVAVAPADVATGGARADALEGVLVTVTDVTVTNTNPAAGGGDSQPINEFVVTGGLRVNDFFHLVSPFPSVGDTYERITGVLRLANDHSKIEPRSAADVIDGPAYLTGIEPSNSFLVEGTTAIPEPGFRVVLNRAADADTTVTLAYPTPGVVTGPTAVTIPAGQTGVDVALTGVAANANAGIVEATLAGESVEAHVRVYNDASIRYLVRLDAVTDTLPVDYQTTVTVALDLPAGPGGQVVTLDLSPGTALSAPATVTIPEGEFQAEFTVTSGSQAGNETLTATVGGQSLTVAFEVTERPEGGCLIISEYIEGSGNNNKAVELFNCGATPIDLSQFALCLVSNAATSCSFTVGLSDTTLDPGAVWGVCKATSGNAGDPVDDIRNNCDQVAASVANFNGDDRLVLFLDADGDGTFSDGDTIADAFGQTAVRPGSTIWNDMTLRRCDFTPYDGTSAFSWETAYTQHPRNDASDFGTPPTPGCP